MIQEKHSNLTLMYIILYAKNVINKIAIVMLMNLYILNMDGFLCDHSILSSGQMTDSRSRRQHGKDLAFIFSTVSAVSTL